MQVSTLRYVHYICIDYFLLSVKIIVLTLNFSYASIDTRFSQTESWETFIFAKGAQRMAVVTVKKLERNFRMLIFCVRSSFFLLVETHVNAVGGGVDIICMFLKVRIIGKMQCCCYGNLYKKTLFLGQSTIHSWRTFFTRMVRFGLFLESLCVHPFYCVRTSSKRGNKILKFRMRGREGVIKCDHKNRQNDETSVITEEF